VKNQLGFRFFRAGPKSYQTRLNNAATLLDLGRICPIGKMWLDAGGRLLQEKETGVTAL
jgi:hypothetical protein